MKIIFSFLLYTFFFLNTAFAQNIESKLYALNQIHKPFARYWWFADKIQKQDVEYNLNWLKNNGFGGVELAFVYPLNRMKKDSSFTPRYEWMSPELNQIIDYTNKYADSIGLVCDITFGTLWPFGDSYVKFEEATQKYGLPNWRQKIYASWEYPKEGYVVDHLNEKHYLKYFNRMLDFFPKTNIKLPKAYFVDSWEVETDNLWTDGFDKEFEKRFGYNINQYMKKIYEPNNKNYLYDYFSLISEKTINFYKNFDSVLNINGYLSRGQVSGAPCDLISGYSKLDIPEGESMLFEPEYCSIPASAAALTGKNTITSESFTCIYGWPRDYIREEQTADLKLVADALFGNGINHIIWHGKAHNPINSDSVNFYATTHLGSNSNFAKELKEFNSYLERLSFYMKKGSQCTDVAVYLPTEDAWLKGIMPKDKQFKWAWGFYEMRYVYFPQDLSGFNPLWINYEFLAKAEVSNKKLKISNLEFKFLYIDSYYLDYKTVKKLNELAAQGLEIIIKRKPLNPSAVINENYYTEVNKLFKFKNVSKELSNKFLPFISSKNPVAHWTRKDGNTIYVFFPNPKSYKLKFPLEYGQSFNQNKVNQQITIQYSGRNYPINLTFEPYQSLLYKLENGKIEQIDIKFTPKTPIIKERAKDYKAPWLVE